MGRASEEKILAKTFQDRMSVKRTNLIKNPETKISSEVEEIVYEDVICALSIGSSNTPLRQEFHAETQFNAVLFTPPNIFLRENDKAEVTTAAGQVFFGITGKTFGYISHGETPFAIEEIT